MTCLFCKNERGESDEHVFAAPFGEVNFIVRFVCQACNSRLGQEVDHLADRDARLAHARHSAGLPIRCQSIRGVDPVTDWHGQKVSTVFDKRDLAAVVAPRRDGDEMIVGRDMMGRVVKDMLRAEFRKAGEEISHDEANAFTSEVLKRFDGATTGEVVAVSHRGLTVHVPRLEAQGDTVVAHRHDDPGAILRVSGKIAFEVVGHVMGTELLLDEKFDDLRNWILQGQPDLGTCVEVLREPDLSGGDAVSRHSVRLLEDDGALYALIAYFGAYVLRVRIGEGLGRSQSWASEFSVEGP